MTINAWVNNSDEHVFPKVILESQESRNSHRNRHMNIVFAAFSMTDADSIVLTKFVRDIHEMEGGFQTVV